MRFLLFTPVIESALLKMWLKVERFLTLNLRRTKRNENWTFWDQALPFQSLFGWFVLSSGGRTKDLVRKIYFGIISKTLVLKFNPSTELFLQFERTFLFTPCTPKINFLTALFHLRSRLLDFPAFPSIRKMEYFACRTCALILPYTS